MQLMIEDDSELLREYGRAIALITQVEFLLKNIVYLFGGLNKADSDVSELLLKGKMLGQIIELSKTFLDDDLKQNLSKLNNERTWLTHAITAKNENEPAILVKGKERKTLDLAHLEGIVSLARSTGDSLLKLIQTRFTLG